MLPLFFLLDLAIKSVIKPSISDLYSLKVRQKIYFHLSYNLNNSCKQIARIKIEKNFQKDLCPYLAKSWCINISCIIGPFSSLIHLKYFVKQYCNDIIQNNHHQQYFFEKFDIQSTTAKTTYFKGSSNRTCFFKNSS